MNKKITATAAKLLSDIKNYLERNEIILAVISGLFLFLSFPQYGFGAIAWFALVPLFFAVYRAPSIRRAFTLGFIAGVVGYAGIIYWITYVVVNYGYLPVYMGVIIMLFLNFYLSVYLALFAAGVYFFQNKNFLCLVAPALWVSLEYLKSYLFTGFPWENLGYSQYLNFYFIQFADVFGIFGLSFIIVCVNAAIFMLLTQRTKKVFISATVVFLVLCFVYLYGYFRISHVQKKMTSAQGVEVSLIQGNVDQSIKWNEFFQKKILNNYLELSLLNSPAAGGLLVWPETALPFNYRDEGDLQKRVNNLPREVQSWFVFGAVSYIPKNRYTSFFNSAYLLSPDGALKGRYDKVHLVPYGEYVPLRDLFPFIKKLTAGVGDFSAGTSYRPLIMGDRKIGVLICYEGILPHASRAYKRQAADLLVNITNDAWFGPTSAPYQHFSMVFFRAVETRLYLVRAANTGISGIIDPCGKIIAKTGIFETGAVKGNVKFLRVETFYELWGDIFVAFCFLFIFFSIVWYAGKEVKK